MKPVHRQAICITRLKKKPSNYNLASSNDVSMCRESRIQLCDVNTNIMSQSKVSRQMLYRQSSKNAYPNPEAQVFQFKENIINQENLIIGNHNEELIRRVKQLEHLNEQLHYRNQELFQEAQNEKKQKLALNSRIQNLQKELKRLESEFKQQYRKTQQSKCNIAKITSPQLKINAPKIKQVQLGGRQSESATGYRRLSFHESIDSHTQDLSVKAKEYKNQLQIEKIRRFNLEKQVKNCKENVRLEFRNQIQKLQHKIDNLKETVQRKDKEINQKENLIQRFIIKK